MASMGDLEPGPNECDISRCGDDTAVKLKEGLRRRVQLTAQVIPISSSGWKPKLSRRRFGEEKSQKLMLVSSQMQQT